MVSKAGARFFAKWYQTFAALYYIFSLSCIVFSPSSINLMSETPCGPYAVITGITLHSENNIPRNETSIPYSETNIPHSEWRSCFNFSLMGNFNHKFKVSAFGNIFGICGRKLYLLVFF